MTSLLQSPFVLPKDFDPIEAHAGRFTLQRKSGRDVMIDELVTAWLASDWHYKLSPERAQPGNETVVVIATCAIDYRVSQRRSFLGGEAAGHEIVFYDDERGIELRLIAPAENNRTAEFDYKPLERLADALIKLGVVQPLGVDETISGDRLSEARS